MSSEAGRRGLLLVISSPSGAGKTSLSRRLVSDHAELDLSISCTTRGPRPGEQEGREYYFVDGQTFNGMVAEDAFLEWAEVHGNRYGSPRPKIMAALEAGRDVLFDIDWQGARSIAAAAASDTVRIFVLPPSMHDLRRRLTARAQDSDVVIEQRLARAKSEIEKAVEYDYVIVNDDFDHTYADLTHIYRGERLRRTRNPGIEGVIAGLMEQEP